MNEMKKTTIQILPSAVAEYVGNEIMTYFGIVGIGRMSVRDGFAKLLKSDNFSRGVIVSMEENEIVLDLHIIVAYGVNIPAVVENLTRTLTYRLEQFTGLSVRRINVFVEGIRVVD